MWLAQLLLLFAIESVGPGLFIVRRWRLSPSEKLVISVGVSYFLVYLGSFAIFAAGLNSRWQLLVTLTCLLLTIASFRDFLRLVSNRQVRRMLLGYLGLAAWALLLLSFVRGYGGGTWGGDWLEHYQRSLFFLGGTSLDFKFIDQFPLPSRPPLMNVVAAHLLAQAGTEFEVFQVAFVLLNGLVFLPCCLVATNLAQASAVSRRRMPWMLLLLLAASPMVCQNLTYTWTKLFTMFYVILGLHLYLRAWRRSALQAGNPESEGLHLGNHASRPRFICAFASFCIGVLVHYSAGPYAFFVGLHYLLAVWWRRHQWAEAAIIASVCVAILGSWFGWSVAHYGPKITFASNSTVTDSAPMSPVENVRNIGKNLLSTIVPSILRHPSWMVSGSPDADADLVQPTTEGRVRDFAFLCYQVSVTLGLGTAGLALVSYLLWQSFRRSSATAAKSPRERLFWAAFILFVYVIGVMVYGGKDRFGVAHICLQGLVLLGLCLLAASWREIRSPIRWLILPGLAVDFCFGIFLQFTLESRDFLMLPGPRGQWIMRSSDDWQSRASQANRMIKMNADMHFWGDRFVGGVGVLQALAALILIGFAWAALKPLPVVRAGWETPGRRREKNRTGRQGAKAPAGHRAKRR